MSYQGKTCDVSVGCPGGLVCNPYTATCGQSTSCPYSAAPPVCPSAGKALYLAPNGNDINNGFDPAAPRATLNGVQLQPGDDITLAPGVFTTTLTANPIGSGGSAECPVVIHGAPDGGTLLTRAVQSHASYLSFVDLSFQTTDCTAVFAGVLSDGGQASSVSLQRCHFQDPPTRAACPDGEVYFDHVDDASILESDFLVWREPVLVLQSQNVTVRANRVFILDGGSAAMRVYVPGAVVEGNDFSGQGVNGSALNFDITLPATARVTRNVFHDYLDANPDGGPFGVVTNAQTVTSNTFINLGPRAIAADSPVFADNIVVNVLLGWTHSPGDAGAYNLFYRAINAYGSQLPGSTDVSGLDPRLGPDFVPGAGSPAIDAADPALPVPPGGGARADIGARERGATLLPDGTYCTPPGP